VQGIAVAVREVQQPDRSSRPLDQRPDARVDGGWILERLVSKER